jgi:hypothetical protein
LKARVYQGVNLQKRTFQRQTRNCGSQPVGNVPSDPFTLLVSIHQLKSYCKAGPPVFKVWVAPQVRCAVQDPPAMEIGSGIEPGVAFGVAFAR